MNWLEVKTMLEIEGITDDTEVVFNNIVDDEYAVDSGQFILMKNEEGEEKMHIYPPCGSA